MTGKGSLSITPNRRLRAMVAAHAIWILAVLVLGGWWGVLLLRQADRIYELEIQLGLSSASIESQWLRTQRMLYGESVFFFLLVLIAAGVLFWLYWRDAMRSKSMQAFFASVTHELRTPLTSIRLQAESIADRVPATDSSLVQRLLEDTLRLESQVERTLELARVEGGGPVFTQPLRLKPWIERLSRSWSETYGTKLEIVSSVGETVVNADVSAMQVILKNCLENAIRHAGKEPVKVVFEAESSASDRVLIKIRDNGKGVSTQELSRLGGIFQKGPASQGAGVGLYLVRVLMERMGGKAEFRTNNGFEVQLSFRKGQSHG